MKILQGMLSEKLSNLQDIINEIIQIDGEHERDAISNEEKIKEKNKSKISKLESSSLLSLISVKENLLSSCLTWTENYVRSIQTLPMK